MPQKDHYLKEKKKMLGLVKDLKGRMKELESLTKDIELKEINLSVSPEKSKELLEEIKVPSLGLLKENSSKK